jgi:hypothetical protein
MLQNVTFCYVLEFFSVDRLIRGAAIRLRSLAVLAVSVWNAGIGGMGDSSGSLPRRLLGGWWFWLVLWLADFSFLMDLGVRFGHLLARVVRFDWFHAPLWPLACARGPIF